MAFAVTGVDKVIAALEAMAARVEMATPLAVEDATLILESKARANLTRYSHARGTPTPSPPGEPPAWVTGRLHDSFDVLGPTPAGYGAWLAIIGPTAPYARIQELGGVTGRGGRTVLPPRPYVQPAYEEFVHDPELIGTFARTWGRAITG